MKYCISCCRGAGSVGVEWGVSIMNAVYCWKNTVWCLQDVSWRCLSKILLFLGALTFSSLSLSNIQHLNGLSKYYSFNTEQFIASLYSSVPSDNPGELFELTKPTKMVIKFTVDEYTLRRFRSFWVESMAINSSPALLKKYAHDLSYFTSLFRGSLFKGDTIDIAYNPEYGTQIRLNEHILGEIQSREFFKMLLATWIGDVPPSSNFRHDLLSPSRINDDLLVRFNAIQPRTERRNVASVWRKRASIGGAAVLIPDNASAKVASTNPTTANPVNSKTTQSASDQKAAKLRAKLSVASLEEKQVKAALKKSANTLIKKTNAPIKKTIVAAVTAKKAKLSVAKSSSVAVAAKVARAVSKAKKPAKPRSSNVVKPAKISISAADSARLAAVSSKSRSKVPLNRQQKEVVKLAKLDITLKSKVDALFQDDEYAELLLTEESLLARQQYYAKVFREIKKHTSIPRQAFLKKIKGDVRVQIEIDRHGNLLRAAVDQPSKYKLFNQHAIKVVKKSAPFNNMPQQLPGKTHIFSVPVQYNTPF